MATETRPKQADDDAKKSRDHITARIGKQVIDGLGQPNEFQRVQVQKLWDDRYRANVLVGNNSVCVAISHSYFLIVDVDGKIVDCTPKIQRTY